MRPVLGMATVNLLGPLTAILISPLLARAMGPEGRGQYAALTTTVLVVGLVGTLGFQDGFSYMVAQRALSTRLAVSMAFRWLVPLAVISSTSCVVLAYTLFGTADTTKRWLVLMAPIAIAQVAYNLYLGLATGAADAKGLNRVKVAATLTRAIPTLLLCLLLPMTAPLAAGLLLLAPVPGTIWLARRLRKYDPEDRADEAPHRELFRCSLSCWPGVLASVSSARLDQLIGLPLIGAHQLGLYAVAVSLAEIPMVIGVAARSVLLGMRGDAKDAQLKVVRVTVNLVGLGSVLASVASWFLIPTVFGHDFAMAVLPTVTLLGATVVYTFSVCVTAILISLGEVRAQSRALVFGSVVGMASLVGLRSFGAEGAAIASLAGYSAACLLCCRLLLSRTGTRLSDWLFCTPRDITRVLEIVVRRERPKAFRRAVP